MIIVFQLVSSFSGDRNPLRSTYSLSTIRTLRNLSYIMTIYPAATVQHVLNVGILRKMYVENLSVSNKTIGK